MIKLFDTLLARVGRKVLLSVLVPLAFLAVFAVSLKVYLVRAFPENVLKDYVTTFIRDNFGKAAAFDDVYVSVLGNIVVSNLNISISGDFNDNISLIKCRTVEIRMCFRSLFTEKPVIRGILFENPDITLYKKYGKGYLETFHEIFRLARPVAEIPQIDRDRFYIDIDGSRVLYREVFRDDTLEVKLERASAFLVLRGNAVSCDFSGKVLPLRNENLGRGRVRFFGRMKLGGDGRAVSSVNVLNVEDLDVSYFNAYLRENMKDSLFIGGGLDAFLEMNTVDDNVSLYGRVEMTSLDALEIRDHERIHYLFHENLNLDFIVDGARGFERITVRRFDLSDDSFRLALNGIYNRNSLEDYFDVTFETNSIDLARFSEHVTPVEGATFGGTLKAGGRLRYDFRNKTSRGVGMELELENFSMRVQEKKKTREAVKNIHASLILREDVLKARVRAALETSKFDVDWETYIKNWAPLSSESAITFTSPVMAAGDFLGPLKAAVEMLYEGAYADKKIGYEQIIFNKEPMGKLLNLNNVKMRLEAGKVVAGQRAAMTGLSLSAELKDGSFSVDNFALSGYGGAYTLKASAQFNLWMPQVSIDAGVKGLDLKAFCADAAVRGEVEGTLDADIHYRVGAFRLSQLLENSILDVSVDLTGGVLKNTLFQERLIDFFNSQGWNNADLRDISSISASLAFSQRADSYQVTKLAFQGDKARFYARGRYDYITGLNVPLDVTFALTEPQGGSTNASLEMKGPIAGPTLSKVKGRKDKENGDLETLPLFNIK